MEVERETLIKVLEAFVDTSELLQRELMLHQMLYAAACKAKGMSDLNIQKSVEAGRKTLSATISEACRENYRILVGKLPRIVDLLASDQGAALQLLKEWKPIGRPN